MKLLAVEISPEILNWILSGIGIVLSALVAAIVAQYRKNEAREKKTEERLSDCEDDRKELHATVNQVQGRLIEIEKKVKVSETLTEIAEGVRFLVNRYEK